MLFPDIRQMGGYDAVILANGEPPRHEVPLRLLREAPFVCCCDGAICQCERADAVVGDGDSLPDWARTRCSSILHQVAEQDDNDLTKATRYCLSRGFRRIVYLGATGLREDHTLGNISLIVRYRQEMGVEPVLATNYGWFVAAQGDAEFASFPHHQVSIFNFGCSPIGSTGLRWDSYAYRSWWQGTLNEAATDRFSLQADGDYLVFRTYEAK